MKTTLRIIVAAVVAFAAGYVLRMATAPAAQEALPSPAVTTTGGGEVGVQPTGQIWTCSMHPQIRRNGPGKCPICGMDLIRLEQAEQMGPRTLVMTEAAKALMDVRVVPVERKFVTANVRLVGKVAYDETRVGYITAWVPGRLDRLFVDYTGVPVKKGDHMVLLYSPQLLTAQEELLQAKRAIGELQNSKIDVIKEDVQGTLVAAREKLRLLGLSEEQVGEIEKRGKVIDEMQINAPMGGIVIEKNALQGMYVETGTRIYTIADLSRVWVKLDAYESDLIWVRYGQKISFITEAYPGQEFMGRVSFIDPTVNPETRTVKVRVDVPNENGKLKPEMFVHGIVRAQVAADGRVMDPDLAGKWICYMHPNVIKDGPGTCDICGMPLVTTESLGYVPVNVDEKEKPLVIPASAPLITGKRAIVYVEAPDAEKPTFEGREVTLGPRAGDYYLVLEGLKEGELVVVEGNFKIDSSLQLLAKPSMMMPEGGGAAPQAKGALTAPIKPAAKIEAPVEFRKQLGGVWTAYRQVASGLAGDDLKATTEGVAITQKAVGGVDMVLLVGEVHVAWMKDLEDLKGPLAGMGEAKDIEAMRKEFVLFSDVLTGVIRRFGMEPAGPVYRLHCPMAFDGRGADWLQDNNKEVRNPYFGQTMPKCGEVVETISSGQETGVKAHE